jgi:hypothetical protein
MVKSWLFRNFAAIGTFHWLGSTDKERTNEDNPNGLGAAAQRQSARQLHEGRSGTGSRDGHRGNSRPSVLGNDFHHRPVDVRLRGANVMVLPIAEINEICTCRRFRGVR